MKVETDRPIRKEEQYLNYKLNHINFMPKSWFFIGHEKKYRHGIHKISIQNKNIVIYKDSSGKFIGLSANCSHMNADLSYGTIKDNCLTCPMHGISYDSEGKCSNRVNNKLQLPKYFIKNFMGLLFIFLEKNPRFNIPFFKNENIDEFIVGNPVSMKADAPWYFVSGNGFDLSHFEFVHQRKTFKKAFTDFNQLNSCEIKHFLKNKGQSVRDKFIKLLYGKEVILEYQVYAGNIILAKSTIGSFSNYMYMVLNPINQKECMIHIIPLQKKKNFFFDIVARFKLLVTRVFIKEFFLEEINIIKDLSTSNYTYIESDKTLIKYFNWLNNINKNLNSGTLYEH